MLFPKLLRLSNAKSVRSHAKNIFTSSRLRGGTYDAEGKTYVDILDNQRHPDLGLLIASYSQIGFRLGNGIYCVGPIVLFSRSVLSWDVGGPFDITPESLSLFTRLEPKLDILVIGIGDNLDWRRMIEKHIFTDFMKKSGINVEILTTEHACATYNFLCTEHRLVAGALIPPLTINVTDQDVIDSKKRFDSLYELSKEEDHPEIYDYEETKRTMLEQRNFLAQVNKDFYAKRKALEKKSSFQGPDLEAHEKYSPLQVELIKEKETRVPKEAQLIEEKKKDAIEGKKDAIEGEKEGIEGKKEAIEGKKEEIEGKKDKTERKKNVTKGKNDKDNNN